ncbi:NADP-specific glutamate dehydrogenase [Pseudobacteriovorax antillogorgiicola]|uniref:Glutamate dehydrogenase n=1 Tax=Pseudobacteriovorax antillogorgiicola TaxID=1513793 RepID=A0A1Y6CJC5_9BACT|nr:NADP-specific glutamate dehydrogenase [Pseudobacteriovorax antillogorgiicola]TCS46362.1 glutamate dehydrogenase (NADP) [Pseudobacteriovorax antillogorgiicola]SMF68437.1 glutamate dehydrogenase (NADP) [Pseudobacteriovorax antillogorgiicola]
MNSVDSIERFMSGLEKRNPGESEFHQAVEEVARDVMPFVADHEAYQQEGILERMTEPDRIVIFRVCWVDDKGHVRANRGYRVQFNQAIGPYKGGLRFHPSVNLSILKFLGFEQIFKNSLTSLPVGGAKGGANFNPKGKSDREVMRFCQAFMMELHRHIGPDVDVPAGDIGVGSREIGYLYGQYKRLANTHTGAITGKSIDFGGSHVRKEATGYGCVFFVENMLNHVSDGLEGKTCVVSGSGNVAIYTAEKLISKGAKVVTLSDSDGFIYDENGIDDEKLAWVIKLKMERRGRIREFAEEFGVEYIAGKGPWAVPCDLAFPSATQNEISEEDAKTLVKNGLQGLGEGANMPVERSAVKVFQNAEVLYAPGKAANAGGVAVSAMEMTQNSMRLSWSRDELESKLQGVMKNIHDNCVTYGSSEQNSKKVNYVKGANIAGFKRVADAMVAYGVT